MKKRIIKLNENDIERLVNKVIKEDRIDESVETQFLTMLVENVIKEEGDEETSDTGGKDNPQDVNKFLELADKYLFKRYSKQAEKINTPKEKATLIAALAKKWGVDVNDLSRVKRVLNTESRITVADLAKEKSLEWLKRMAAKLTNNERLATADSQEVIDSLERYKTDGYVTSISQIEADQLINVIKYKEGLGYQELGESEERLDEIGYDSPEVFAQHAGNLMGQVRGMFNNITKAIQDLEKNLDKPKSVNLELLKKLTGGITMLTMLLEKLVPEMPEDDLAESSTEIIKVLKTFERRIRTLVTASHAYSDQDFSRELEKFLVKLTTSMMKYGKTVMDVDKRLFQRVQGKGRGDYGSGYDLDN